MKNYRPQILVLTGNPTARQVLVDFAHCITKGTSLLVCGHVIPVSDFSTLVVVMRRNLDDSEHPQIGVGEGRRAAHTKKSGPSRKKRSK